METNRFTEAKWYANRQVISLPRPTNDTSELIAAAQAALQHLFLPGRYYKRAGVAVSALQDVGRAPDWFGEVERKHSTAGHASWRP